ncbi:MAG: multi-sensor signal transduction histidine kinase [Acidimicrobiales bacterium]|nr:multi-sensor signal transduction histidine kinase [Acidimicrobiales bacterium]
MRRWWAQAGLRTRARAAYVAVAVVGLLGIVFVAVTFGQLLGGRQRLADRLDPAGFQTRRWVGAVVDQESGLRGYALSGDETFLEPYEEGGVVAIDAERRTRELLAGEDDLLAAAGRFTEAADGWRRDVAEPLVATVLAGGQPTQAELRDSKERFDRVRILYRSFQDELDLARTEARVDLDNHTTALVQTMLAAVVMAAIALASTWLALNRWVIDPVDQLARDARLVASGDLRHPVAAVGPPDMELLAVDMEAMRRRILDELALVEMARVRLEDQALDLSRSNQELEQFAYVASHDLQEPLRKITGFCQLLQRRYGGELDERADEYIGFAVDGAKRMQVLINDLLAFSRVGRTTEGFTSVDLGAVATRALATLEGSVTASGATVEVGALPTTQGDPTLLELMFQNLIGNALKFRGEEPPVITVSAHQTATGWEFTCADNGIGIEPAYAERVFVIFQRLNSREDYEGTGIGLAMCRKIVEFHGGTMGVDPQPPGTGTTIRWTLPTAVPRLPATTPAPGRVVAPEPLERTS